MEHLALLKKLEQLGVEFCLSVPSPGGSDTYIAKPEELLNLLEDPTTVYAKHYGVTKSEYLAWTNENFSVRCSGTTKKGTQFKNIVPGGCNVTPDQWIKLQGEYCNIHGADKKI